jgi:hypothetical protein
VSTLKSSAESLILNADGSGNDVIIQSDGSTKAIVTAEGTVGIGTTSPSVALEIYGDSGGDEMALKYSGTAGSHTSKYLFKDFRGQSNAGIYNHLENDGDGTAAARLEFHTATGGTMTKRMTIQSGGDVTVENGDIVFGTAGKGICLGATSNTDANTLDDYEEGTWTPSVLVGTGLSMGTVHTNKYTKIGQVVTLSASFNLDSSSSQSASGVRIGGFPFSISGSEMSFPINVRYNYKPTPAVHLQGNGYLYYQNTTVGGNNQNSLGDALDTQSTVGFTFSYIAT